jgi:hypothetical protein
MKKSIFLTALLVLVGFSVSFAQGINFGLNGVTNISNFEGNSQNFNSESITSYHAGLFLEFGLSERVSIQRELLYSTVGANMTFNGAAEDFRNE